MSFATVALWVAGAGILAMALTAAAVALLPLAPTGRALVALAGIALTIVAMGAASNHVTKRAIRAEFGDDRSGAVGPEGAGRRGPSGGLR